MRQKIALYSLAFPIFVENFLTRLLGMANVFLLSLLSQEAVAAIGVANQYINLLTMMFSFVTFGAAVIISQNLGAKQEEAAKNAANAAIWGNLIMGVLMGLLVLVFHRPLLRVMSMESELMDYAGTYLLIIGGLCVIQGANLTLAVIMRNYGQTRLPMLVFLLMNAVSIAGSAIVVLRPFGLPDFGIAGIAWCTVGAQALALIAMSICCWRSVHIRISRPQRNTLPLVGRLLGIGVPGTGDNFGFSLANICFTYFVSTMGTLALTSQTYAQNYIYLVQILGYSIGQASQILVCYKCGAGEKEEAYHLAFRNMHLAMVLNVSCMVLVFIFRRPLLQLFGADEAAIRLISICFLIDLVLEVGRPMNLVISTCQRGTGDVIWGMCASLGSLGLLCVPLGFLLTQVLSIGLPGIFIALCVDEWARGLLSVYRWRSRKWEKHLVVHA